MKKRTIRKIVLNKVSVWHGPLSDGEKPKAERPVVAVNAPGVSLSPELTDRLLEAIRNSAPSGRARVLTDEQMEFRRALINPDQEPTVIEDVPSNGPPWENYPIVNLPRDMLAQRVPPILEVLKFLGWKAEQEGYSYYLRDFEIYEDQDFIDVDVLGGRMQERRLLRDNGLKISLVVNLVSRQVGTLPLNRELDLDFAYRACLNEEGSAREFTTWCANSTLPFVGVLSRLRTTELKENPSNPSERNALYLETFSERPVYGS